jgi:hypothetical protein
MHQPQRFGIEALAFAGVMLVCGLLVAAEPPTRAPADDLPEEFRLMSGLPQGTPRSWRLLVRNEKVREQEAARPDVNAVQEVWQLPLSKGRHVLKIVFSRPYKVPEHVFHLYVNADGDAATGRKSGAVGVDYMYTYSCKTPDTEQEWWAFWDKDGSSTYPSFLRILRDEVLYLCVDMDTRQQDGASVFELRTNSYIWQEAEGTWKTVLTHDVGPVPVVGDPEPAAEPMKAAHSLLLNPALELIGGRAFGWWLKGGGATGGAKLERDAAEQALRVAPLYAPEGLLQPVRATPGHYLLRALARTNVFQVHLVAGQMQMPVAVGSEYRWVELPFVVKQAEGRNTASVEVGFRYCSRPATGNASLLPATLWVKQVELQRLGDTALQEGWIETLPVHPRHHLDALEASPSRRRPGKVVFQDSFIGTELWLMTQGGQDDHSYVGHPNFSRDGKYLHFGARQRPAGLLRTDGEARYLDDRWLGLVWPFPWMDRQLPKNEDPADWVVVSRNAALVELENAVTGARHTIELPTRPGWTIVHYPGLTNYGLRGPRIPGITHDTLVWLSEEGKAVATSTAAGREFRPFAIPSLSAEPAQDTVSAGMSFVGGKSGENWCDAVDGRDERYFFLELNRDNLPNHATNPYQMFALPLTGKARGPLRVVPHPAGPVTAYVTSQTGPTQQPSAKWWDYAAGFPWSGDDACLLLEDGTLVHMSSLGLHSGFHTGGSASTVSLIGLENESDRFVGTYHKLDRISWPHEFRRDRDFAVVEGYAEPASPILMIDLEHETMWTAVVTNFHDYLKRYSSRWNEAAYHKPMFRLAPNFSPDFTKVCYFSPMLTGDVPERKWGDLYVAVVRYPEPPQNLRVGMRRTLSWDLPRRQTEIRGFRLYHSAESGRGYRRVSEELLTGTRTRLSADAEGFYALTSVEHSGLEGRLFSNEVQLGSQPLFRQFHEVETGRISKPMVPFFEPAEASGAYAVAVTDPEYLERRRLAEGLRGTVLLSVRVPDRDGLRLWARVRGMSELERASYTRGWPGRGGAVASGAFALRCGDATLGRFAVTGPDWHWVQLDAGSIRLPAQALDLELSTADAGVAVDCLCLTNDPDFQPAGRGREPGDELTTPADLRLEEFTLADADRLEVAAGQVKIAWQPSSAPQGVTRYQVYRGETSDFAADPEHLLGSPSQPLFYDCDLEVGRRLFYRVRALDAWGNLSGASPALAVTVEPPALRPAFEYRRQAADPLKTVIVFAAGGSRCDKGKITQWQWAFGDGATGEGPEVTHAYTEPGRYTVTLRLGTDLGAGARLKKTIQINPAWVEGVRTGGGVWLEAEDHRGEGGGTSRIASARINASDRIVTYWEKDLGHWLEWKLPIRTAGVYAIALRYASGAPQALRDGQIDGTSPGKDWQGLRFPGTGGYCTETDNWVWRLLKGKEGDVLCQSLSAGEHTLRLTNRGGGMALDAILLIPSGLLPPAP